MKIRKFTCDNGLTVFLASMENTHMMTGVFAVRGGWGYETKDIEGMAHLLEHLMFRGTARRPSARELAQDIEKVGGRIHAYTTEEIIAYFIHTPPRHKMLLCDVLSDFILNRLLDPAQSKIELESMIEELRKYESHPVEQLDHSFDRLLFGEHPAGWPGVGTEQSVRSITRESWIEYYHSCFVGSNSALCIAGPIPDPEGLFNNINRMFSPLSSSDPARRGTRFKDTQKEPRFSVFEYNIPSTYIKLGVKCPIITLLDKYPLKVLKAVLAMGWTSRLYHRLMEEEGLIYELGIDFSFKGEFGGDTSYFAYWGGVKQERWLEAVRIILDEFARLKTEKVGSEELEKAKRLIIQSERNSWEDSESVADYIVNKWADYDKVTFANDTKKIREVTSKDIMRVANKFFRDNVLNLAVVGPHGHEPEEIKKTLHF